MVSRSVTRRDFALLVASFVPAVALGGTLVGPSKRWRLMPDGLPDEPGADDRISRTAEAIHLEEVFPVGRKRLYEALTTPVQFEAVTRLSQAGKVGGENPTLISPEAGGTFSLFGGHIVGRHVELIPDERIVQAWRVTVWDPGVYSVVKFVLTDEGSGARLILDHTGFPEGTADHLAAGWRANYLDPLKKYLS